MARQPRTRQPKPKFDQLPSVACAACHGYVTEYLVRLVAGKPRTFCIKHAPKQSA